MCLMEKLLEHGQNITQFRTKSFHCKTYARQNAKCYHLSAFNIFMGDIHEVFNTTCGDRDASNSRRLYNVCWVSANVWDIG